MSLTLFLGREVNEILNVKYLGHSECSVNVSYCCSNVDSGCPASHQPGSRRLLLSSAPGRLWRPFSRWHLAPTFQLLSFLLWVSLSVPFYPSQPITRAVIRKYASCGLCRVNMGRPHCT